MRALWDTARELSWQARYTRTPDGTWTRRQWRVAWDNIAHPRRMGALQAEQELWDGLLGDVVADLEELRAAPEYPDYDRLHENDGVPFVSQQANHHWDDRLPDYPLADWPDPWNTGHHFETAADGTLRAVADTPEIAARDERYHQAAAEFREETGFYVAPDGWDTEYRHDREAAEETHIAERAADREAGA